MEYVGRDLGEYEITALHILKQAYRDVESGSGKARAGARAFFEDSDNEYIFSYRFIMDHFRDLGFRTPGRNPFRPYVPGIEGEGGQFCFCFYTAICPKNYVSNKERLKRWERYPEKAAGGHSPVSAAA